MKPTFTQSTTLATAILYSQLPKIFWSRRRQILVVRLSSFRLDLTPLSTRRPLCNDMENEYRHPSLPDLQPMPKLLRQSMHQIEWWPFWKEATRIEHSLAAWLLFSMAVSVIPLA